MSDMYELLLYLCGFAIVAVAARRIAHYFLKIRLPLITGLLVIGIIAGPFVADLIPSSAINKLQFLREVALGFIAFAAGSELFLKELRGKIKSIAWNTFGQLVVTFVLVSAAVFMLLENFEFTAGLDTGNRIAIAILTGTISVARSPSSAIAVINEMRARGPFTQITLGVTVLKDVLVIILFATVFSISKSLANGTDFDLLGILIILVELGVAFGLGFVLSKLFDLLLKTRIHLNIKAFLILLGGYGVFVLSHDLDALAKGYGFKFHMEPLLVCIIASFILTNFTSSRIEFAEILKKTGAPIYVIFFTLIGASIELNILQEVWLLALLFFAVRLVSLIAGAVTGGVLAQDPKEYYRISWMAFITQAGVGIGLATTVEQEFLQWGPQLSTILISVIVFNQIVGPPFYKWAIELVKEGHPKAVFGEFEGERTAIVFGLEDQTVALARQLQKNGWNVKIASRNPDRKMVNTKDLDLHIISGLNQEALVELEADKAQTIVTMLTDEENYQICELAYEKLGTKELIVRLNDRANFDKFHQLGALIVDPSTAIVSLLDHFVRSPQATSLLLGMETDQDSMDLEVQNKDLHGLSLRDLRLPAGVIILAVKRGGHMLISHGYTRLRMGDIVTMVGSIKSLESAALRFSEQNRRLTRRQRVPQHPHH